jgi:beta-lactamase class C
MIAAALLAASTAFAVRTVVDRTVLPLMARFHIPGMAVGVIDGGKSFVFNYGLASTRTRERVSSQTLFELGSISKTFTATLASYAQVQGYLSLSNTAASYLPSLRGTPFGNVTLVDLGTHVSGGLPLQVPTDVRNVDGLTRYLEQWRPTYPAGAYRTYSNVSIGMLGLITAKRMGKSFDALIERFLFPALGMTSSYIHVPKAGMAEYAQGYSTSGSPIRMVPGTLSSEAYGVKSTATDVMRFLEENMRSVTLNGRLARAISDTHTGYFKAGPMTQALIWEEYAYPVSLASLLKGNSSAMLLNATRVSAIKPPQRAADRLWIDKTGTTNGFGAYVAFIPERRLGIVMLANRNYPIPERVTAAYEILTALSDGGR